MESKYFVKKENQSPTKEKKRVATWEQVSSEANKVPYVNLDHERAEMFTNLLARIQQFHQEYPTLATPIHATKYLEMVMKSPARRRGQVTHQEDTCETCEFLPKER